MRPPEVPGYRVDAHIGRGGWSDVWLAWSRQAVPRPVALKVIATPGRSAVEEWRAHRLLLERCAHPNLLAICDVVSTSGQVVLVLPYLSGGSLADLLTNAGTLTAGELVALMGPLTAALAALHRCGAVHGDVKPANVLLSSTGEPRLADAAVASRPGTVAATPVYLAPECADLSAAARPASSWEPCPSGSSPSPAADVFALGAMAYEALTGMVPHRGEPAQVLAAAAEGAHRPLSAWPGIPTEVAEAVEAALDPRPARRPDPEAWAERLGAAVDPAEVHLSAPAHAVAPLRLDRHRTVSLSRGPAPSPPSPDRRRRMTLAIAAGIVTAAVSSVAIVGSLSAVPLGDGGRRQGAAPRCTPARRSPRPDGPLGPARPVIVDLGGVGCDQTLRWRQSVLTVGRGERRRRYAVGRSGDQVLAGDWDGDGLAGIAVYEPDHGRVLYADVLPDVPGATARAARVQPVARGGRAYVGRRTNGRDEVRVRAGP